jgi:hypothetical protein
MMMETYKRQNGCGFGSEKIGESSGQGKEKIGDILAPPKTYHNNAYVLKPYPLLNKLDTNPDPPIFPHSTTDFQKTIKFISTLGNVFFGKESEKVSEKKPVDKPSEEKPVEKLSGEKPNEQPHPNPKTKPIRFHCVYCGRDGHKDEFCFKKSREERMAKDWANKDKYHTSSGVLKLSVQMPRAKASVRTVPAWGERKAARGVAAGVKPVRPVWRQQGGQFGFRAREESRFVAGGRGYGGWSREFVGGQFARRSPPLAQYGDERSHGFEVERRNGPRSSFRGICPPPDR